MYVPGPLEATVPILNLSIALAVYVAQVTGNGLSLPAGFYNKKEAMSFQGYIVLEMVRFWVTVGFFLPSCNFFLLIFKMFLLGVGISEVG